MAAKRRSGDGVREIAMVLAVGLFGLVLVALVAFTPWYADASSALIGR
jgi:hypothetical protein